MHRITKKEAQEILELGLNRYESYMVPEGGELCRTIDDNTIDRCWDIVLFLKEKDVKTLGFYAGEGTKAALEYGRSFIQINLCDKNYDIKDTILHELAHHIHRITRPNDHEAHGNGWKHICRLVGAEPTRYARRLKDDI